MAFYYQKDSGLSDTFPLRRENSLTNKPIHTDLERIASDIENINLKLDKICIGNFMEKIDTHRTFIKYNFFIGLVRGFGMAVGFTILGAIIIYILQKIVLLNIPVLGDFISDIVRIVQEKLSTGR
jgi:hypothetical protein